MKNTIVYVAAVALLLTGCCTCTKPQGQCYAFGSAWTVVNNTGYPLDLFQNGQRVASVGVGQVVPVHAGFFQPDTVLTAIGHTESGAYVGTSSHRFYAQDTDVWTVTQLLLPQPPQ